MLNAAHIGVAVKNATPEVKAAADYVTEHDNNHNAIAEVIERFIPVKGGTAASGGQLP